MQYSHSRIETFKNCPYKYKLRYIDKLETLPSDDPQNPLIIGSAMHIGIEQDAETAVKWYYRQYPVITDLHVNEAIKLENLIPKVKAILPKGEHEVKIETNDYIGFADLVTKNGDIYDFKYSNNMDRYLNSKQIHLYKYYRDLNCDKTGDLYYLFIPKTMIRQKKTESLYDFRKRLNETLSEMQPKLVKVDYDENKIDEFYSDISDLEMSETFEKVESNNCKFCEFCDYCGKGVDYMILPSVERRKIGTASKHKIWIYGQPFSGKTTFLDKAPNPLNLNTDGNIANVTMPYISIKDVVTMDGRVVNRKYAWEVFKETIEELEKGGNKFKTIIVDLVEDTREMCRLYKYNELGIEHESDSGFGKGWDIIKTEYLSTMRRFFNLDYDNLVIVSHEDISKDITKKNGQNITKIAPNIQESIANKLAGMVDVVARVVVEDDGERTLNFKSNEVVFGGGRLQNIKETTIPLDWDELMNVFGETPKREEKPREETPAPQEEPEEEKPKRKTRKARA
jgi:phage nucleotide-binding protein